MPPAHVPTFNANTLILSWPNISKPANSFGIKKLVEGSDVPLEGIQFQVDVIRPGETAVWRTSNRVTGSSGEIAFWSDLVFSRPGVYTFKITETLTKPGFSLPNGAKGSFTFNVYVTVNGAGEITATSTSVPNLSNNIRVDITGRNMVLTIRNIADSTTNHEGNISGYVWEDERRGKGANPNGIWDQGESPMPGITVELWAKDIDGPRGEERLCATTTTNSSGYYYFNILPGYCATPLNREHTNNPAIDPNYLTRRARTQFFVIFKYDGLEYTTTVDVSSGTEQYNKSIENTGDRQTLINRYGEIGPGRTPDPNNVVRAKAERSKYQDKEELMIAYKQSIPMGQPSSTSNPWRCTTQLPTNRENGVWANDVTITIVDTNYNSSKGPGTTYPHHCTCTRTCYWTCTIGNTPQYCYGCYCPRNHSCGSNCSCYGNHSCSGCQGGGVDGSGNPIPLTCPGNHSCSGCYCPRNHSCSGCQCSGHSHSHCPVSCCTHYYYWQEDWDMNSFSKDEAGAITEFQYTNVNLGLLRRDKLNLVLWKDFVSVELTINDQYYEFLEGNAKPRVTEGIIGPRPSQPNAPNGPTEYEWYQTEGGKYNLKIAKADQIRRIHYERPIVPSDYNYRVNLQGRDKYGYDYPYKALTNDNIGRELRIFLNYEIVVLNDSQRLNAAVTEIVDYYDDTLVPRMVYTNKNNPAAGGVWINDDIGNVPRGGLSRSQFSKTANLSDFRRSKYSNSVYGSVDPSGYKTMFLNETNLGTGTVLGRALGSGQGPDQSIYIQFEVIKRTSNVPGRTNDTLVLGEKYNYAEINGHRTDLTANQFAMRGQFDINSTPGNYINVGTFEAEDDTDWAPPVEIYLEEGNEYGRSISGKVWEEKVEDGLMISLAGETFIPGMRVELVEKLNNSTTPEFVWGDYETYEADREIMQSIIVQKENYTKNTVERSISRLLPDVLSKATAIVNGDNYEFYGFIPGEYEIRFVYGSGGRPNGPTPYSSVYGSNASKTSTYSGCSTDYINRILSIAAGRRGVENPLKYTGQDYITTSIHGPSLHSKAIEDGIRRPELDNAFRIITNDEGNLLALVDPSRIGELLSRTWSKANVPKQTIEVVDDVIPNQGMGLIERPNLNLIVEKEIAEVVIKQNNGVELAHIEYARSGPTVSDVSERMLVDKITIAYSLDDISVGGPGEDRRFKGVMKVKAEIEEALIGGSQLEIVYEMIMTNVGRVPVNIRRIVDYIDDDIAFREQTAGDRTGDWKYLDTDARGGLYNKPYIDPEISRSILQKVLAQNDELKAVPPGGANSMKLYLSTTMDNVSASSENGLQYKNMAELLEYESTGIIGRRNYEGIPGNQVPHYDDGPGERDADMAEVTITPPLGVSISDTNYNYIEYIIAVMGLVAIGIITGVVIRYTRKR